MIAAKTLSRPRETYFLTCRVMCAFTLEAYLNHAGSIVDSTRWAKERRFFACNTPYPGTRDKKVENADMMNERKTLRKAALTVRFQRTMG